MHEKKTYLPAAPSNPPTAYMLPLTTATPNVLRLASMLGQEFQVSFRGSYTSILRTRNEPLKPPTAYTKPFNTATPVI